MPQQMLSEVERKSAKFRDSADIGMIEGHSTSGGASGAFPCPVCGCKSFRWFTSLRDNRTGAFAESFSVARCTDCGLVGLRPQPDQDKLFAGYERGYGPYPAVGTRSAQQRPSLGQAIVGKLRHLWHVIDGNATIDRVPVRGRVLDVGAGRGELLAWLLSHGHDAIGIDPNPHVVQICRDQGLPVVHGTLDSIEVIPESFDTVVLSQVFEHLIDPVESLQTIHRLLRTGGRVILFTPNVEGWPRRVFGDEWGHWHLPYHVYLYGPSHLRAILEKTGFRVERLSSVTPGYWLELSFRLWRRKSQSGPWTETKATPSNFHPSVRLAIAPFARLLDFTSTGDCFIAVGVKR